jgi:hypothetical protein
MNNQSWSSPIVIGVCHQLLEFYLVRITRNIMYSVFQMVAGLVLLRLAPVMRAEKRVLKLISICYAIVLPVIWL